MKPLSLRTGFVFALVFGSAVVAANVEEKYDNGKPKLKYNVDDQGRKDGLYQEFYPTGKIKLRATFKGGKLAGPYTEFDEKARKTLAATYKDGKLNGNLFRYENGLPILSQPFKDGEAVFPKSREKIAATLKTIYGTAKPGPDLASQRDYALRRLKAYRYLCDVPYQDLTLDDSYTRQAQAAAAICDKLKRLDHEPPNPGLPASEYNLAKMGAARSNLAAGLPALELAIDAWMDDSIPGSIEKLGHRRWCLNPAMAKTGFGKAGPFAAMYSFDSSRKTLPDFDYVCYPPRGLVPATAFQPRYGWCFCPNPRKFKAPDGSVKAKITAIDEQFHKIGSPLELDHQSVDKMPIGMLSYCVIFRPEKVEVADGQRFLVEIEGLKNIAGRPVGILAYPVIFVALTDE